jgi:hypothetical protein
LTPSAAAWVCLSKDKDTIASSVRAMPIAAVPPLSRIAASGIPAGRRSKSLLNNNLYKT